MSNRSARRNKNVYERIDDAKNKIAIAEEELAKLKMNLRNLESERDDLEMHQLFNLIKNNGISFEQAKNILSK